MLTLGYFNCAGGKEKMQKKIVLICFIIIMGIGSLFADCNGSCFDCHNIKKISEDYLLHGELRNCIKCHKKFGKRG